MIQFKDDLLDFYQQVSYIKINILSGTIVKAETFERARKPAYKVWADFGPEVGILQTSAQVTVHYTPDSLIGRQILGVTNLGSKNIAGFESQFLLVGCEDPQGAICLATLTRRLAMGKSYFDENPFLKSVINSALLCRRAGSYEWKGKSFEIFIDEPNQLSCSFL